MIRRCIVIIMLAVISCVQTNSLLAAEFAPKPAELKVLEKLIGDWTTETTITIVDGKPQNLKSTGTAVRKWALDGRIVEENAKSSTGEEFKMIFSFDAARKAYRSWYFSSTGITADSSGQWDEATQAFSFEADLGNGVTQISTILITDADNQEWTSKVTDATGTVLFSGNGKLTRKK